VSIERFQHFPLLTTRRQYPLGLNERIVYSFLAYRDRLGRAESIRGIAAGTTLDGRTVSECLTALGGLVKKESGKWKAVEPSGSTAEWFAARKAKRIKHWSDNIASMKFFLPKRGATVNGRRFTLRHAAVYAELRSFSKGGTTRTTITGLGTLLNGLDEATVRTALDILQDANLIRWTERPRGITAKLLPVTDAQAALFSKKPEAPVLPKALPAEPARPSFPHPDYEAVYDHCLASGIPHDLALEIVPLTANLFVDEFLKMSARASKEHIRNCRKGRFHVKDGELPHHGRLLLHKLKQIQRSGAIPLARSASIKTYEEIEREQSPEAKAEARRLEEEIAANPLHPGRLSSLGDNEVMARVQVGPQQAYFWLTQISRHVHRHCESTISDYQEVVRVSGNLTQEVVAHALDRVNDYYLKDPKATTEEFEAAVNAALEERGLKSIVLPKITQPIVPSSKPVEPPKEKTWDLPEELAALDEAARRGSAAFVEKWADDLKKQME
jgi:hypothetical protein